MNVWRFFRARPGLVNLLAFLACCVVASGWLKEHDQRVRNAADFEQQLADASAQVTHWDSLRVLQGERVQQDGTTVTRTITRYHTVRDTLTDTLPAFVHVADSAVAACTEYQQSCEAYRHVTDSLVASLRRVIAVHESRTDPKPPRFSLSGAALYDPIRQVPALDAEMGVRVVAGFSLVARAEDRLGESPRLYVGVRRAF